MSLSSLSSRVLPNTPVGPLTVVASLDGIRALHFGVVTMEGMGMGGKSSEGAILDSATALLEAYFRGEPVDAGDLAVDAAALTPFSRRVLGTLRQIPWGSQTTYGSLAQRVGCPRGARAIGQAVGANPIPILIPCHRVLPASGRLGGFSGGVDRKRILLNLEGWADPQG